MTPKQIFRWLILPFRMTKLVTPNRLERLWYYLHTNQSAFVFERAKRLLKEELPTQVRGIPRTPEMIQSASPNGHFYSPVVDTAELNTRLASLYPEHPHAEGMDFNDASHLDLLEQAFARYLPDYDYPEQGRSDDELTHFYTQNSQFSWLDSRALFALLRHWRPRRIIEVGSGYSSLLMADINLRFLSGETRIQCVEPYPRPFLHRSELNIELIVRKVQELDLAVFEQLQAGDLLFIDSSHVCKTGSDVTWLFLKVLPRLKPGVRVHIHDIFLPTEYPKQWVLEENRSWNEQYILHSLLMFSSGFKVLFANHYAFRRFPEQVCRVLNHPTGHGYGGGSFYIERN